MRHLRPPQRYVRNAPLLVCLTAAFLDGGVSNAMISLQSQHTKAAPDFRGSLNDIKFSRGMGTAVERRPQVIDTSYKQQFYQGRPAAVIAGAQRKMAKLNKENEIRRDDPTKAAQIMYRLPANDPKLARFISIISDLEKVSKALSRCPLLVLYTGSFAASAKINEIQMPQMFEKIPELCNVQLTQETCSKLYDIFLEKLVEQLCEDGLASIKKVSASQIRKCLKISGGNVLEASLDLLARVQTLLEGKPDGFTSHTELGEGYASEIKLLKKNRLSPERAKALEVNFRNVADFLRKFPPSMMTEEHAQLIRSVPLYNQVMGLDVIEDAFLHLSAAANRALVVMSRQTRTPDALYNGINSNVVHYWLAALRHEQLRWQKANFPSLDLAQLERRAAQDLFQSNHEKLRNRRLGAKADPPLSYARSLITDEAWRSAIQTKVLGPLNYFYLFEKAPVPRMTAEETADALRDDSMADSEYRRSFYDYDDDDDDYF